MSKRSDTQAFIDTIKAHENYFAANEPIIITRAPGRLDVMGGIADYSGSLVLQLPIADATHVALQKITSPKLNILSLATTGENRSIEINLTQFDFAGQADEQYSSARACFSGPGNHWASYIAGVFPVLSSEKGFRFENGATILIKSSVPEGKGVSSSAALEVSVMQAVNVAFNLNLECRELAKLCQKVENLVAGAPCGIMDQMTSACGEENRLLELLCQPDILKGTLPLPDDLELWGIDSGVRHSVSGSDYGTVRTAAFMGYRMISDAAQLPVAKLADSKVNVADSKWNGYLANITPDEFESNYEELLPPSIDGSEFLDRYQGTTDTVTAVRPGVAYPVLQATKHPIYEHARVQKFAQLLKDANEKEKVQLLGPLMFESHQSYTNCGLGSEATDLIVDLVRDLNEAGLYGARITGGGSGGTVAVLGRRGSSSGIEKLRQEFQRQTGYLPLIIAGSSPGARVFDHIQLQSGTAINSRSV